MKNECDGCINMDITDDCHHDRLENCPCKNCLVKVMCTIGCPDLIAHSKKAWEIKMETI